MRNGTNSEGEEMEVSSLHPKAAAKTFEDFTTHMSGQAVSTETAIVTILRGRYPDHEVTLTSPNIIAFSKSEHAHAEIDIQMEDFSATRCYAPPIGRNSKLPGEMRNKVHFGRYLYRWNDESFIVYQARFQQGFGTVTNNYILHKRGHKLVNGRCQITDDLIAAAEKWSSNVHKEVLVFDQEQWLKSKDLYASVQNASWDDVIMDKDMKESLVSDVEGFFDCKEDYKEFAVPWKRGIVLYGLVSAFDMFPLQES